MWRSVRAVGSLDEDLDLDATAIVVHEALALLDERFADPDQDGPAGYAQILASPDADDESARLRQQAVTTVRAFLRGVAAD